MKTNNLGTLPKQEEVQKIENVGLSKSLFKYIRFWKWFVFSMAVCIAFAVLYLKMASPVYEVKAKILLNEELNNGSSSNSMSAIQDFGLFNVKNNTDNELEVLNTSNNLFELVVRKLGLYANCYEIGELRNNELYGTDCPISVRMPDTVLDTLNGKFNFEVEVRLDGTYVFMGNYGGKDFIRRIAERDSQVVLPFGLIYFCPGSYKPTKAMRVSVSIENPSKVAESYLNSMKISLASETTTAINLVLNSTNTRKGIDLLNSFLEIYKEEDIKDRDLMAKNNSVYLDDLLISLGNELSDVEKQVETFKQREGLTNVSSEAQLFIQRTGQYEQKRLEVGTQLGIVKDLESYINRNVNHNQLLPSGIGIENGNLNTLISEYNNQLLERKRLSRTATESNQVMIDLNDRIDALFKTVQSSVSNEKRNLMIAQQDLVQKDSENATRIKSIPRQEREISDLSRQQDIKSQLYLFLLQKRDENYLTNAAMAPKFKVLSQARTNGVPVSPKRNIIFVLTFVMGLFIPVLGISLRDLLHYTVENRDELKNMSSVPILGEIPKSLKSRDIIIHEEDTDGFTEMFRLLRTNLMFVLNEPWKKVINIVSSINGEGKTSIAINLAHSLALLDKKVLIIGLDIRKPKMGMLLGIDNATGVTQYLSGHLPHTKLIHPSGIHPNLWVINAGPVPPNPNELLAKPALDELIDIYREQFDYIIIDTPPLGAVSDSLLLNRFSDVNLYIVRADYTPKSNIIEANDIFFNQQLNNMYFVLNATNFQKTSNYYQLGCRKRYSSNYGYGNYGQKQKKQKK